MAALCLLAILLLSPVVAGDHPTGQALHSLPPGEGLRTDPPIHSHYLGSPDLLAARPEPAPGATPALRRPDPAYSGAEPAPMGIGDLGGPSGGQPGDYSTEMFRGTVDIGAIAAYNHSFSDAYSVSFQLNAFLVFEYGSNRYAYWAQDVALLNSSSRAISFEDNVWNASSDDLEPTAISGNGTVAGMGSSSYYGYGAPCLMAGACIDIADPQTVVLELTATLGTGGTPTIRFLFADGGALRPYDTVTFPYATSVGDFPGFSVDPGLGFSAPCPRCFGDVELVLGGPGNGYQTALSGPTYLNLSLEWWNGYNFEAVPNAVDHGEATAEMISHAIVQRSSTVGAEPTAALTYGTGGGLHTLWTQSQLATIEVSVVTGTAGGTLSVNASSLTFSGAFVETTLIPGTFSLAVKQGASTYALGTPTLTAGEVLSLEVGADAVVFVPVGLPPTTVWSVTLNGQDLYGTGNITFGEASGSYNYSVANPSGFRGSPASGNVSVGSGGAMVTVTFSATHSSLWSDLLGVFGPYGSLFFVLIALAVILVVVAVVLSRRPSSRP